MNNRPQKKPFKRKTQDSESEDDEDSDLPKSGNQADNAQSKEKIPGPVTSLFKSNPDLPILEHKDFKTVSENVFSSKSIKDMPIHPHAVSTTFFNSTIHFLFVCISFDIVFILLDCKPGTKFKHDQSDYSAANVISCYYEWERFSYSFSDR